MPAPAVLPGIVHSGRICRATRALVLVAEQSLAPAPPGGGRCVVWPPGASIAVLHRRERGQSIAAWNARRTVPSGTITSPLSLMPQAMLSTRPGASSVVVRPRGNDVRRRDLRRERYPFLVHGTRQEQPAGRERPLERRPVTVVEE